MSLSGKSPAAIPATCLVLLCALAVVLLNSAPATAAPTWLAPIDLSATGADAVEPDLTVNEAGDAVVAWRSQKSDGRVVVEARTRSAGGAFSAPVPISTSGAIVSPQVALNPAGDAVVSWFNGRGVEVATRPAGGSFSAPAMIRTPGPTATDLQVALDAAGDVVVSWLTTPAIGAGTVETSTRPAGGSFSAPAALGDATPFIGEPRLALTPAGDAIVVWLSNGVIQAATRPAGGSFSTAPPLSPAGGNAMSPRLALNAAGDALVVWTRNLPNPPVIEAASRRAGGSFLPAIPVSVPNRPSATPDVALNAAGDATAVWIANRLVAEAASRPAGGSFSAPAVLSREERPSGPQVALDAAGNEAVVWSNSSGITSLIEGATRSPGGAFSAPVGLSAKGQTAVTPQVALDAAGNGIAVWSRSNSSNMIVQAAFYDAAGPQLRGLSIPTTGIAGEPLSFSASPVDALSGPASVRWNFGDGGSAAGQTATHTYARPGNYQVSLTATDAIDNATSTSATLTIKPGHPKARSARTAKLRGRKALLNLSCPVTGPCGGTAKLTAKQGHKKLTLGKRSFRIDAGKSISLAIALGVSSRRLREAAGRKGIVARLEGSGVEPASVRLKH